MAHLQKHKHFVPQFVHFHQTFQNNEIFNSKYETNRLLYLSVKCQCGFFETAFQKIVTFNSKYETNKPKPQAKPPSIRWRYAEEEILRKGADGDQLSSTGNLVLEFSLLLEFNYNGC